MCYLLIYLLFPGVAKAAEPVQFGELFYELNDSTMTATVVRNPDNTYYSFSSISIPSQVIRNDSVFTVTTIGKDALSGNANLISITLPETLNSIEDYAFRVCGSLSSIVFPDSLSRIGEGAFIHCEALETITIPKNVKFIGNYAFTSVLLRNVVFNAIECSTSYYYSFPKTIQLISFGDKVTVIPKYMLQGCTKLKNIELPNSLLKIGTSAFASCTQLESIVIPESVIDIWPGAFSGCTNLKTLYFNAINCKDYVISGALFPPTIENLIFGDNVLKIPASFMAEGSELEYLKIPENIKMIGEDAFRDWKQLKEVDLPDGLETLGGFRGCSSLRSVKIPNSVTTIGMSAFQDCDSLESIEIPENVANIYVLAFAGCERLDTLVFNARNLEVFPTQTNYLPFPSNISYLEIGEGVTKIPTDFLYSGSLIESVTLPESLAYIGYAAFKGSTKLKSIRIPENVTYLGAQAFEGCESLETVYFDAVECQDVSYGGALFPANVSSLIIGEKVKRIPRFFLYDGSKFERLVIPNSVESVGQWAFANNTNLKTVEIGENADLDDPFENCNLIKAIWHGNAAEIDGWDLPYVTAKFHYIKCDDPNLWLNNSKNFWYIDDLFDVDGIVYVPVTYEPRQCVAIDCLYSGDLGKVTINDQVRRNDEIWTVVGIEPYALYGCGEETVELPLRLKSIGASAFENSPNLKTIRLHGAANDLPDFLADCPKLEKIILPCAIPPTLAADDILGSGDKSGISLIVPDFACQDYKDDNYWSQFGSVTAGPEADADYWEINGELTLRDGKRMAGSPDVSLSENGALRVIGQNQREIGNLGFSIGKESSAAIVNECEHINAQAVDVTFAVDADNWYFFTPAFDINAADVVFPESSNHVIRYYDGAERAANGRNVSWKNVDADGTLRAGCGYILQCDKGGDVHFAGAEAAGVRMLSASQNDLELTSFPSASSIHADWNLVGNPYPSYYDISYLEVDAPIIVYSEGKYVTKSVREDHYLLRPMEAFFVQKPNEDARALFPRGGCQVSAAAGETRAAAGETRAETPALQPVSGAGTRASYDPVNPLDPGLSEEYAAVGIGFRDKSILIDCERADAEIRYSIDGSDPTVDGTIYTAPFLPEGSCTVRAAAWLSGEVCSDVEVYEFDRDAHSTPQISFRADYCGGELYVDTDYGSLSGYDYITVDVEGAETLIRSADDDNSEPIMVDVKLIDKRARIEVRWHSDVLLERDPEIFEAVRAEPPTLSYDGRMLEITHSAVATGTTECPFMLSGYEMLVNSPSKVDILAPGSATFVNWSNQEFVSPEAYLELPYFHDGDHTVALKEAGHLEDAFQWNPELAKTSVELILNDTYGKAPINAEDLRFLKTMSELRSLDMRETTPLVPLDDFSSLPNLETVSLPSEEGVQYGAAFEGCPQLTRVIWNSPSAMPQSLLQSVRNPNALVETEDASRIPSDHNVLIFDWMTKLRLEAGYPFRPASAFTAEKAEFVKTFGRETKIGVGQGWETICLPFDAEQIEHEEKGLIAPFGSSRPEDGQRKRFWLAQPRGSGWVEADAVKALQPYIIAMPNSREYLPDYNLPGTLTFRGSNVEISADEPTRLDFTDSNGETRHFGASFSGIEAADDLFTLADGAAFKAGSDPLLPFECYFDGIAASRAIRIASARSGIDGLPAEGFPSDGFPSDGEVIESRFAGKAGDPLDPVFDAAGLRIGTRADIPRLRPGLYICAGRKILINR